MSLQIGFILITDLKRNWLNFNYSNKNKLNESNNQLGTTSNSQHQKQENQKDLQQKRLFKLPGKTIRIATSSNS